MNAAHDDLDAHVDRADHVGPSRSTVPALDLQEAIEFIWLEADLLDTQDYAAWLALWTGTGHYVIPIERVAAGVGSSADGRDGSDREDHAAQLNIIYDDHAMRAARVKRLTSGLSMSASPSARTCRTVSRFRRLDDADGATVIRCAQHLVEYKYDRTRILAADVTYRLVRTSTSTSTSTSTNISTRPRAGAGLALERKVVRLINSDDALFGIGYLL
jgi:3-phenylpropionate/cinnamic acid dioxygenase small subunit